jgi:hypothetical protein
MRKSTRLRFFLAATALSALAAFFVACGDDDGNSDITGPPDAASETSKPETSTPETSVPDTGPKDAAPDGPVYFAGDATVLDAGPEYEGGIACVFGGQIEEEKNDEPDAANPLRTSPEAGCVGTGCSRCGVIFDDDLDAGAEAGDGGFGGTEYEYLSFVLHPATKSFYLQFAGDITLTVTVEGGAGSPYTINTTSSPTIAYVANKPYYVRVTSNTGKQTPWRVTLFENQ